MLQRERREQLCLLSDLTEETPCPKEQGTLLQALFVSQIFNAVVGLLIHWFDYQPCLVFFDSKWQLRKTNCKPQTFAASFSRR